MSNIASRVSCLFDAFKLITLFSTLACCSIISVEAQTVDPLTGRAVVEIPLGTLSARDITIGVSLSHHGGALRVDEGPGNAGMGWNVRVGGFITREVRGLPDDYSVANDDRKGRLYNGNALLVQNFVSYSDDNLSICTDEYPDANFLKSVVYGVDTEPDLYYFQAPGISGKFVYDENGIIQLTPYQDLTITLAAGQYTIKTPLGLTYVFAEPEHTTRQAFQHGASVVTHFKTDFTNYQSALSFISTWNLVSITSSATGQAATFSYVDGTESYSSRNITLIQQAQTNTADTLYYVLDIAKPRRLTQASVGSSFLNLQWTDDLIQKVVLSESGESREYEFLYKITSPLNDPSPYTQHIRPFLSKLRQMETCGLSYPAYAFAYHSIDTAWTLTTTKVPVDWHTGHGQDFFGYNNGQGSNKNIPTVYYYQSETGGRRFTVVPINGLSPTAVFAGGNRSVNFSFLKIGALTRIDYPAGGSTFINYENNKYFDSALGKVVVGPGLRVSSIVVSGGERAFGKVDGVTMNSNHVIRKAYAYTLAGDTTSSGRVMYPPSFAFVDGANVFRSQTDLGPGSEVLYKTVKESVTGQGYRVYQFDIPNAYPDVAATTNKVARVAGGVCGAGNFKNGGYSYPFAPLTDYGFRQGLLKKISEYSEAGILTQEKRLSYTDNPVGANVKGLRLEQFIDTQGDSVFQFGSYQVPVGQSRILSQEIVKMVGDESPADSTKTTTAYTYTTKNWLTQSTQTNPDNSVLTTYIKYAADFPMTTPSGIPALGIAKLNATGRSQELIETWQTNTPSGGSAVTIAAQLNTYKVYGNYAWLYQTRHFPLGAGLTPSFLSASQALNIDADYIVDNTFDFVSGVPVNQTGQSLTSTGTHYSTSYVPVASFYNCKAENAIYEGFEETTGRGLTGATPTQPAWTGRFSATIGPGKTLTSAASTTALGTNYRVSLWAYATTANTTITVTATNGTSTTLNLICQPANVWQYLEGTVTIPYATFTLTVTAGSNTYLDDFVVIPNAARVSFQTTRPLAGITSQSDDRGNSVVYTYDGLGRRFQTFDRNRNMVEQVDYSFEKDNKPYLLAGFTANTTAFKHGVATTFNAPLQCASSPTYDWTFTDAYGNQSFATGASVVKTFGSIGLYTAKLTVSAQGYQSATFIDPFCVVLPDNITGSITVSPNNENNQCDPNNELTKTFTANLNASLDPTLTVVYEWFISNSYGEFVPATLVPNATVNGNVLVYLSPLYSYTAKCVVNVSGSISGGRTDCSITQALATAFSVITFTPNNNCP